MKTINKPGDNLGGLTKLWAVPKEVYSRNGTSVSISDTTNVYEIYCTPESMEFNEPQQQSDAGKYYKTVVSGFSPGDTESNLTSIEYIERRKWVILFKDGNGKLKAAGSSSQPLSVHPERNSGRDTTGRAGYTFSFVGETTERAQFVDNPF
ncbi:hypothetical protein OU798_07495 [Prolixibacteraceae bacterium Z1-6]|uniref:Uncharacterized protein n=1 Tax=Draconibacterium aestuarii TaxID=2998507 RepID=A0A9X3J665_9BACT|nr:hypothetical protein [Prolixibacteraceae bacterium Z1-6]